MKRNYLCKCIALTGLFCMLLWLTACGAKSDSAVPAEKQEKAAETKQVTDTEVSHDQEAGSSNSSSDLADSDSVWASIQGLDEQEHPWVSAFLYFAVQHGLDPAAADTSGYTGEWTLVTSYIPGESCETVSKDLSDSEEYEIFITDQMQLCYAPLPDHVEEQFEAVKNDYDSTTKDKLFIDYVIQAFGQPSQLYFTKDDFEDEPDGDFFMVWEFGSTYYVMTYQYMEDTGNYYMSMSKLYNDSYRLDEIKGFSIIAIP